MRRHEEDPSLDEAALCKETREAVGLRRPKTIEADAALAIASEMHEMEEGAGMSRR